MAPAYCLRSVLEREPERWQRCWLEISKRAGRRNVHITSLAMAYGMNPNQEEQRGAFVAILRADDPEEEVVGLMHLRGVVHSKQASVMDYFALWVPNTTERERLDLAPELLRQLAATMTGGDFVMVASAAERKDVFAEAGFRISYTLLDLRGGYDAAIFVADSDGASPQLLRFVRGLDSRNPTFSPHLYDCTAFRCNHDGPRCLEWAPKLCQRCRKAAFCDDADLREHESSHEQVDAHARAEKAKTARIRGAEAARKPPVFRVPERR